MNITTLFKRKREMEQEAVKPIRGQYLELVRALARGEEIDEAEVFVVCDELAIDEARLSKDVSVQQERFSLGAQLEQNRRAVADVATFTAESEKLNAERQAFFAKWQPKWDATYERLHDAQMVLLTTSGAEAKLVQSCLDFELLERSQELADKRHKIGMQLLSLQDEVANLRNRIAFAKRQVDQTHSENAKMPLAFTDERQQIRDKYKEHNVKLAKEKLADEELAAKPAFHRYDRLKAEQLRLENEIRELNKLKLEP